MSALPSGMPYQLADGLWCVDSSFKVMGCRGSMRMTVMAVGDGLYLHSPVPMDETHRQALMALGPVRAIIAPNLMHHMFLRAALEMFPEATVHVPDGLEKKIGVIPGAIALDDASPVCRSDEIVQHSVSGHGIRETVFFHAASRTLVTADLLYNYQSEQFMAEKAFFRLAGSYGKPSVPFYHRMSISDKSSIADLIDWVKSQPVQRVVMAHGRIWEDEAAAAKFAQVWTPFSR